MYLLTKILCSLFLLVMIPYGDSFPQFSIPNVPWSKDREESSFPLSLKVLNIFPSPYGRTSNPRQHEKILGSNEVVRNNENIITVTPNPTYYYLDYFKFRTTSITTEGPHVWENDEKSHNAKEIKIKKSNVKNLNKYVENERANILELKNADENILNTDYADVTTESTTEYETTTDVDSDLNNRVGYSGHVVATLLG